MGCFVASLLAMTRLHAFTGLHREANDRLRLLPAVLVVAAVVAVVILVFFAIGYGIGRVFV